MQIEDIINAIIKEQSQIIGDQLAKFQAASSGVVKFDSSSTTGVIITQDGPVAIEKLIDSYKVIFGQSSVEVCLDVLKTLPYNEVSKYLPESIRHKVKPHASNTI